MAKRSAASAAPPMFDDVALRPEGAVILDLDGVAERRQRFAAHAAAASRVAVYEFSMPDAARVQAVGSGEALRDARDQLLLVAALAGGAVGPFPGGLAARIPVAATGRFEALAKPLIEAFLIGWRV